MKRILVLLVGLLAGIGAHAESFDFYQSNIGADAGVLLGVLSNDGDLNNVGVVELLLEGKGFTSYPADLNASLADKSAALSNNLSALAGNLKILEQILFNRDGDYSTLLNTDFGTKLAQLSGGAAAIVATPVTPPAKMPAPAQPAGDLRAAMLQQLMQKRAKAEPVAVPEPEPAPRPQPVPVAVVVPQPVGVIPAVIAPSAQLLLDKFGGDLNEEQRAKLLSALEADIAGFAAGIGTRSDVAIKMALKGHLDMQPLPAANAPALAPVPVAAPLPQPVRPAMPGAGGQGGMAALLAGIGQGRAGLKAVADRDDQGVIPPVPPVAASRGLIAELRAAQAARGDRSPAVAEAVAGMTDEEIAAAGEGFGGSARRILSRVGKGLKPAELEALKKLPEAWLATKIDDIDEFDDKAAKELLGELKAAQIFKTRGELEIMNLKKVAGA